MRNSGLKNEKGMALVLGLMFLVILLIIGFTSITMTVNELKISDSAKRTEEAYYVAHAGIEEARRRLKGLPSDSVYAGDPVNGYDKWWSAYLLTSGLWQPNNDPSYDADYQNYIPTSATKTSTIVVANSLQSSLSYFVKIRHKREYDAEQSGHTAANPHYLDGDGNTGIPSFDNNIVFYGYGDASQPTTPLEFTISGTSDAKPVEIVTAYGRQRGALSVIEAEMVHDPGPAIVAALYARQNITGNGTSLSVDGNDNCSGGSFALPPVYTLSPSTTTLSGMPTLMGDPPHPVSGPNDINVNSYVNTMKSSSSIFITSDKNGVSFGSSTNFVNCYSDTANPYNVSGLNLRNTTGYGLLLVQGDLTLEGGFKWYGLILCTGVLVFNGGGAGINIQGAVLANQTIDLNGGIFIKYDKCMVENSLVGQSLRIIHFKEVYY